MSLVESEYMDIMEGTKPLRFVKIKDPCTKLTMVKLKDPKHPIKMYNDSKHQIIDLHKVINRGDGSEPDFGYHFKKL